MKNCVIIEFKNMHNICAHIVNLCCAPSRSIHKEGENGSILIAFGYGHVFPIYVRKAISNLMFSKFQSLWHMFTIGQ